MRSVPSIFEVACRSSASAQLVGRDAVAVVLHPDQPLAAVGIGDVDPPRAGVERVLDQLLHRRGRALHHLARRDAVRRRRVELADRDGVILGVSAFIPQGLASRRAPRHRLMVNSPPSSPSGRPTTTKVSASGSRSRRATRATSSTVTASTRALRRLT